MKIIDNNHKNLTSFKDIPSKGIFKYEGVIYMKLQLFVISYDMHGNQYVQGNCVCIEDGEIYNLSNVKAEFFPNAELSLNNGF